MLIISKLISQSFCSNLAGNEANANAPRGRIGQISHSVLLGTFNVGDQGEGIAPDLTRVRLEIIFFS